MKSGHFQPLVSRRVTAMVEMHCGANTNQARKASAVGQASSGLAAAGSSVCAACIVVVGVERIDGADRRHRDFARGHRREQRQAMSWLKPIGATTTSMPVGDMAGDRDVGLLLARPGLREAGQRPQHDRGDEDDRAGALQEDHRALPQADARRRVSGGQLIFGQLHHEAAAAALDHRAAEHQRGEQRADDAGDVEPEQHQPLQADARADGRAPG